MRIASLVPSSTELLFALGLGEDVVAVTHECDYPAEASLKPQLTRTAIPDGLGAAEIDAEVRRLTGAGRHLYELDAEALASLEVDLIVTQAVCEVCAVSHDDVIAIAARLPSRPAVVSLDPTRLEDVIDDVGRLGAATGAGEAAAALERELRGRLAAVEDAVAAERRPAVIALEWLDPPFVGGHWVPEMVRIAGGADVAGRPGERSRTAGWDELAAARPELVVAMPCGWDAARARREVVSHGDQVAALGAGRVVAVDAASSFSRPGPRLVEGIELLAHLMHPDRVQAPPGVGFEELERTALARAG